uniref:Myeloid differentiation primary response protein MyD88 n=1 Tax=Magallana gigas TaxID=29159 RepID=K1RJN9_MAGGI
MVPLDNQINRYDAYVIAGDTEEDKLFLETMKSNLESSAFNLRLYIKSRDGPGDFDHQKESEIIMNSCEKIIVVLSRDFTQNEQCMYLLRVAISKSPGFHLRHIIPIHREECLAPSCIRFLTANDYTKEDIRDLCESDSEDEDEDSSFESVVFDFSTEDIPKHEASRDCLLIFFKRRAAKPRRQHGGSTVINKNMQKMTKNTF